MLDLVKELQAVEREIEGVYLKAAERLMGDGRTAKGVSLLVAREALRAFTVLELGAKTRRSLAASFELMYEELVELD